MKIPKTPPDVEKIIDGLKDSEARSFINLLGKASSFSDLENNYYHWDKLRFLELPEGVENHKVWWTILKIKRNSNYKNIGITGMNKIPFKYTMLDSFSNTTHFLDQFANGQSTEKPAINPQTKDCYLLNSLIEESITSSQLEGATTTRDIAKKMIQENRTPRDRSEQMILNNYKAISFIRTVKNEKLSPELIKEIHNIIAKDTLDKPEKAGVYRDNSDDIHVMTYDNESIFTPPSYKEINKRIDELCNFANADTDKTFTHPVIKAIIIHFLLAYIHPFTDGNGRTARALFYWYMLKKGYWLAEFISISRILKKAPAQYALSYLYTETDENDLTYFIGYQLETIRRSIDELNLYIKRKMEELESIEKLLKGTGLSNKLNNRQVPFLKTAIKSPGSIYTIQEYSNMHNVVYQTARNDLLELSDNYELLLKLKKGKTFVFVAPSDLENRLRNSKA